MDDKQAARQATIRLYVKRIVGDSIKFPQITYTGYFDCESAAEAVPLPTTNSLGDHQNCWNRLYTEFSQRWAVCPTDREYNVVIGRPKAQEWSPMDKDEEEARREFLYKQATRLLKV